jgi:hypothetical protein
MDQWRFPIQVPDHLSLPGQDPIELGDLFIEGGHRLGLHGPTLAAVSWRQAASGHRRRLGRTERR